MATVRPSELLAKLKLEDPDLILREREPEVSLFWTFGESSGAVRTACDIQVDVKHGPRRPKLSWRKLMENDFCEWTLKKGASADRV